MCIHPDHVPAECLELFRNRLGRADFGDLAVDLETVVVNDGYQVVQVILFANIAASQTCPSSISPSPRMVYTL